MRKDSNKWYNVQGANNARNSGRQSWRVIRPLLSGGLALSALAFIVFATPWFLRQAVFVTNKTFVLRHFDIQGGETLTPPLLEELLGSGTQPLKTGTPLFAVNIAQKQREFLLAANNLRQITITRVLPDTLRVRIEERRPLVRVQLNGGLVADSEGVIFVRYRGTSELPLLTGLEGVETSLEQRLNGMAMAAVNLVVLLENQPFRIPITAIDVAHVDYLKLALVDQKQVLLSWPGMLAGDGGSMRILQRTLAELARALNSERGRNCRLWNATVPGRISAE